jgi:hypothetical protein
VRVVPIRARTQNRLPVDDLTGNTEQERCARHIDQVENQKMELEDNKKNQTTAYTIHRDKSDGTAK